MDNSRRWKGDNTFLEQCIKFNTIRNSKAPSIEWKKINSKQWNKNSQNNGNWGLVCGKVNNCIGLDLDLYRWEDDHPFYAFIGTKDIFAWAKQQNTLCVKTTSNGLHLIYKLNENELKCINDEPLHIDIKGDGGYLVGAGSIVKSKITNEWSEYTIFVNTEPTPMPDNMIEWLYNNLSYRKNNNTYKNIKTTKVMKVMELDEEPIGKYIYDFTHKELDAILNKLPETYITGYTDWLKTATAMKSINQTEYFLDYCKRHPKTRRYTKNITLMNGITKHTTLNMFNHILKTTKFENARTMLDYKKYKPIISPNFSKEKITYIDIDKLGKAMEIASDKSYVIKSDTGTGKTTLFKQYAADNNLNVISIVSRISLGDAQYLAFNEAGIDIHNYRCWTDGFRTGMSVIITIDSIIRLSRMDFSDYVVFLDEYNSLVEYLVNCPNLRKVRCIVFKMLLKILKECKQVIAVDADIHSNSLKLLKHCKIKYDLVINKYLHNKSNADKPVPSKEIFTFEDYIAELQGLNECLVACDSKTDAETIFNQVIEYKCKMAGISLKTIKEQGTIETEDDGPVINTYRKQIVKIGNYSYALITSDTDEMIELDAYDFVVFSPKIVYGLDSIRKRPVFAHYKEHTISPKAMLQQIARCRNIEYLRYIFYKKKFLYDIYSTLKDVEEEGKKLTELNTFTLMCSKEEEQLFISMFNTIHYNEDAYRTNKFAHFKQMLSERGFDDTTNYLLTSNTNIIHQNAYNMN